MTKRRKNKPLRDEIGYEFNVSSAGQKTLHPRARANQKRNREIEFDEEAPWTRVKGETARQFAMFETYLKMPRGARTVVGAWRASTYSKQGSACPSNVYEAARKYRWASRAVAYDEFLKQKAWAEDEELAVKALKLRNAVLVRGMSKLSSAIDSHNLDDASTADLTRFAGVILKEAGEAFAPPKETKQRVEIVNGGDSEMVTLADQASNLTDAEVMAEFRRLIPLRRDPLDHAGSLTATDDD